MIGILRDAFSVRGLVTGAVLHVVGGFVSDRVFPKSSSTKNGKSRRGVSRSSRRAPLVPLYDMTGLSPADVDAVTVVSTDAWGRRVLVFRAEARASIWKSLRGQRALPAPDVGDVEDVVSLSPDLRGAPVPLEETAEAWARDRNGSRAILAPVYLAFDVRARRFLRAAPLSEISGYAGEDGGIYAVLVLPGAARALGAEVDAGTAVEIDGPPREDGGRRAAAPEVPLPPPEVRISAVSAEEGSAISAEDDSAISAEDGSDVGPAPGGEIVAQDAQDGGT